jgi:hypothetical protein
MTERNTQRCSQPADQPDRLIEPHRFTGYIREGITVTRRQAAPAPVFMFATTATYNSICSMIMSYKCNP